MSISVCANLQQKHRSCLTDCIYLYHSDESELQGAAAVADCKMHLKEQLMPVTARSMNITHEH